MSLIDFRSHRNRKAMSLPFLSKATNLHADPSAHQGCQIIDLEIIGGLLIDLRLAFLVLYLLRSGSEKNNIKREEVVFLINQAAFQAS